MFQRSLNAIKPKKCVFVFVCRSVLWLLLTAYQLSQTLIEVRNLRFIKTKRWKTFGLWSVTQTQQTLMWKKRFFIVFFFTPVFFSNMQIENSSLGLVSYFNEHYCLKSKTLNNLKSQFWLNLLWLEFFSGILIQSSFSIFRTLSTNRFRNLIINLIEKNTTNQFHSAFNRISARWKLNNHCKNYYELFNFHFTLRSFRFNV